MCLYWNILKNKGKVECESIQEAELIGWRGSVEHQRRKNVSVNKESWEPGVVWMEGVSGEGQISLVSNRLLVAPCNAQENKALDSLSQWSEAGVVSDVGYFRVWGWVVGSAQCKWYQVLEYLPTTAIINSWHPSGENSSSWMLLVSKQTGCDGCCIKGREFWVGLGVFSLQQKAKWAFHCHLGRKTSNSGFGVLGLFLGRTCIWGYFIEWSKWSVQGKM